MNQHQTKIVLTGKTLCNLDQYRNNMGELAIYLPKGVSYQIVENADELSDLERIGSDYTTSFDMNVDNRTKIILGNVQYQNVKGYSMLQGYLAVGDVVHLEGFVLVNQTSDRIKNNNITYSFQVIGTHQTWKDKLRANCFGALDLGSIIWNNATIAYLMEFNDVYKDGNAAIYPFLADFGQFHQEQYNETIGVSIYDLRFLVYKLPLIRAMFALAGYCIKSAFLESEYFRRAAIYALKPNFYELGTEAGLEYLRVNAYATVPLDVALTDTGTPAPYGLTPSDTIPFSNVITNNSSYWNNSIYWYQNLSIRNIDNLFLRLNVTVCGTGNVFPLVAQVYLYIFDSLNNYIFDIALSDLLAVYPNLCDNFTQLIPLEPIFRDNLLSLGTLNAGWQLEVRLYWLSTNSEVPTVQAGSSIEYLFGGKHFYEDENINIASALDCSQTLYDHLLDFKKENNLFFLTDEANKIVYIEPQPNSYINYEAIFQAEKKITGFELGQNNAGGVFDITDLVDVGQTITKNFEPQSTYNRIVFKFKDSTDNHPAYDKYKIAGNELWRNDIQTGNTNTDNELEIGLSIYEPTLNQFVNRISYQPALDWRAINIPVMWDNSPDTDGSIPPQGTKYEPRIFMIFGFVNQLGTDPIGGATLARRWVFENLLMIDVPTVAQALPPDLFYQNTFTPFAKKMNNIFSDNFYNGWDKNLVNTFYLNSIQQVQSGIELTLDIRLNNLVYKCMSIRQIVRIFSEKMPLIHLNGLYRILRLVVNPNEPKHAQITLQPIITCEQ